MTAPRLILFDVDGTLVDSQASILSAMGAAFGAQSLAVPSRDKVLGIVGLSLDRAVASLAPDQPETVQLRLVEAYRAAFHDNRQAGECAPLYPGARAVLDELAGNPDTVLGVATGKSRRGLDAMIEAHGLERYFATRQVADFHPSKPHPSMIDTARAETGMDRAQTVMIGDTSFDMQMARAAGVSGIGVTWGYHGRDRLGDADALIDGFGDLADALKTVWKTPA